MRRGQGEVRGEAGPDREVKAETAAEVLLGMKIPIVALVIGCLVSLGVASSYAQSPIPLGTTAAVSLGLAGCRDIRTMNRMAELLIENDVTAAVTLAARAGPMCKLFEPGMKVLVERFSEPHSLVCIRLNGDPDCYWFPSNFLRH